MDVCKKKSRAEEKRAAEAVAAKKERVSLSPSANCRRLFLHRTDPSSPRRPPSAPYPLPSDSNRKKIPFQAEIQADETVSFKQVQGGAHRAVADQYSNRPESNLDCPPWFLPKSQYLSCQRCCAIAAFANSFLPVVCHLWELRRKQKSFSGKQDAAGRGKKRSRPREGVMSVFSSSPSFYFSSRFFAFLFVKAQKIPSDRRWPTH